MIPKNTCETREIPKLSWSGRGELCLTHDRLAVWCELDRAKAEIAWLRPIAKAEQLEQCDPNGTWYDVAQAALRRVTELEKRDDMILVDHDPKQKAVIEAAKRWHDDDGCAAAQRLHDAVEAMEGA